MKHLKSRRNLFIGGAFVAILAALGIGQAMLDETVAAQNAGAVMAPRFEVDPLWPKPLPNHWVLGQTIGVFVDTDDHIWIVHRSSSTLDEQEKGLELNNAECCAGAPPVLEFDQAGNLLRRWGGPGQGYEWPSGNHGIYIDHKGFVWIGGNGPDDSHVLKFTKDGRFVMQVGKKGVRRRARRTIPPDRRTSSSATRCTAPICRSIACCMSATARTIACRCSRPKDAS
jgi:hypothetical protein